MTPAAIMLSVSLPLNSCFTSCDAFLESSNIVLKIFPGGVNNRVWVVEEFRAIPLVWISFAVVKPFYKTGFPS